MIVSMSLGILAVGAASAQSISVSMLNRAIDVRKWLSDAYKPWGYLHTEDYWLGPLRASLSAQQLIRLLLALQTWAGVSFLVEFVVYLGSAWTNHDDTDLGMNDNRSVFIVFLAVTTSTA